MFIWGRFVFVNVSRLEHYSKKKLYIISKLIMAEEFRCFQGTLPGFIVYQFKMVISNLGLRLC